MWRTAWISLGPGNEEEFKASGIGIVPLIDAGLQVDVVYCFQFNNYGQQCSSINISQFQMYVAHAIIFRIPRTR